MAYVYRHIRLDKNIPFYIGIGNDSNGNYKRAYSKQNRNKYWHNISNKHGYEVEILIDDITWGNALLKEVEFIAIHKRVEHSGILVNLTDGGEGNVGYITSEEAKKKQSLKKIGKPPPNKGKPMLPHVMETLRKINKGKPSWNKGIPQPAETKEKRLVTMRANGGFKNGSEHHNFGKEVPSSVREAISKAKKGSVAWNKGIPQTEEQRLKNSLSKIGRTAHNKGIPMTEEQKLKISITKKMIFLNKREYKKPQ